MSLAGWIIWILIIFGFLFIILAIGWSWRNSKDPVVPVISNYSPPNGWEGPTPSTDEDRNFCQVYQFPNSYVTIKGEEVLIPGNPTLNTTILNGLQPLELTPTCLDPDQIWAQQVSYTCTGATGVSNPDITKCVTLTGEIVGIGDTETLYNNVKCSQTQPCTGELAVISINYQVPNNDNIFCITNANNGIYMFSCDLSQDNQIFRITKQSSNPLIVQLYHRATGLCLDRSNISGSSEYNGAYLNQGCPDQAITANGVTLTLSDCDDMPYSGYVWALIPATNFYPNPNKDNYIIIPPQISYVGGVDQSTMPISGTYKGLTGNSAIIQWCIDNNILSLYWGAKNNDLVLTNFGIDASNCNIRPYTSQYLNVSLFNIISKQAVCFPDYPYTNDDTQPCIPL